MTQRKMLSGDYFSILKKKKIGVRPKPRGVLQSAHESLRQFFVPPTQLRWVGLKIITGLIFNFSPVP